MHQENVRTSVAIQVGGVNRTALSHASLWGESYSIFWASPG